MSTEREREHVIIAQGPGMAEGIEADADRQNTVIEANAYREAEQRGGAMPSPQGSTQTLLIRSGILFIPSINTGV